MNFKLYSMSFIIQIIGLKIQLTSYKFKVLISKYQLCQIEYLNINKPFFNISIGVKNVF